MLKDLKQMRYVRLHLDLGHLRYGYHDLIVLKEGSQWVRLQDPANLKRVRLTPEQYDRAFVAVLKPSRNLLKHMRNMASDKKRWAKEREQHKAIMRGITP